MIIFTATFRLLGTQKQIRITLRSLYSENQACFVLEFQTLLSISFRYVISGRIFETQFVNRTRARVTRIVLQLKTICFEVLSGVVLYCPYH